MSLQYYWYLHNLQSLHKAKGGRNAACQLVAFKKSAERKEKKETIKEILSRQISVIMNYAIPEESNEL
jgi:hypothetical protein